MTVDTNAETTLYKMKTVQKMCDANMWPSMPRWVPNPGWKSFRYGATTVAFDMKNIIIIQIQSTDQ